jgi:16S rRNA (cytosine967-C5)-methyltransferase
MKYDNQVRYASAIVKQYNGQVPLSAWLKQYFRNNKQMGSRDRKTVAEMVYGYYRLGHQKFDSVEERLLAFIATSDNLPEVRDYFFNKASNKQDLQVSVDKIFPFKAHLSDGINSDQFSSSFLVQPNLFLRIRPGKEEDVFQKLNDNFTSYHLCSNDCLELPNSTKIESVLQINSEVVVQDKSSQATGRLIREVARNKPEKLNVWDCCAASGGKSIMAHDFIADISLTVSDIRESIISNLHSRFQEAKINNYTARVMDVASPDAAVPSSTYDLVIADVPCSGSGTWSRTPEQLYFFREEKINYYSDLQKRIVSRVIPSLKPYAYLLYITCSVFREENEDLVEYVTQKFKNLEVVTASLIKGYEDRADTLYTALFINRSA